MYRKEVNQRSPLRILERSTKGGLGPGNLGVVMARAGVGKTAFLVQIGIDDAMRERPVLHVALGQSLDHVRSWYDALFDDLAALTHLENREQVRALVEKNRLIQAYPEARLSSAQLDEILELYARRLDFQPRAILIDGFDWEAGSEESRGADLGGFKKIAERLDAELWLSAQTHRAVTTHHPSGLTPPCSAHDELIDLAVFLEPEGRHVTVRLLKDHDNPSPEETHLQLQPDTMRLVSDDAEDPDIRLPPRAFTLLSGGAKGTETLFGEAAERWGVHEIHFSFAGRETARRRGVVHLGEEELERGAVSEAYINAQLHRSFPHTETFQRLLKSIWHQVATAGELFVVGEIQDDDTVKGGTGWSVELARHFHKPVHVFDQKRKTWFRWTGKSWTEADPPRIRRTRFAGTGTRFPTDEGRRAISELFTRSFGRATG